MFNKLSEINTKPEPFQYYTTEDLWTDDHTSKKMLEYHLNGSVDASSRNINFINRSVAWMVGYFNLNAGSHLLDLGCGPGLYTNRFAEEGINVTGVDFSGRSIEYARKTAADKGLLVDYRHENYLEFETDKKFDLITMIMCDYSALSPVQRKVILGKCKFMLEPSGKILLDVYSLNYFNQKDEISTYEFNHMDGFWSPEDYYCFVNTFKYNDIKVLLDKYTIIEKKRTRVVYNWLQCFTLESLKKEFEENNLMVDNAYADVCGREFDPGYNEFAVIAGNKQ
jgi:2-polyprenyl-3-methyl-5-hydroxy-6-metoxy-1,4-benzoquinol methylase